MAWETIGDAAVAPYAPITARLIRKLRDRYAALAPMLTLFPFPWNGSTSSTTAVPLSTVAVYLDDRLIGPGGTRITVAVSASYSSGDEPPNPIGRTHIRLDGTAGVVELATPGDNYVGDLVVEEVLTPGVYTLELMGRAAHATHSLSFTPYEVMLERIE